jgi:hypothetical protein
MANGPQSTAPGAPEFYQYLARGFALVAGCNWVRKTQGPAEQNGKINLLRLQGERLGARPMAGIGRVINVNGVPVGPWSATSATQTNTTFRPGQDPQWPVYPTPAMDETYLTYQRPPYIDQSTALLAAPLDVPMPATDIMRSHCGNVWAQQPKDEEDARWQTGEDSLGLRRGGPGSGAQ